MMTSSNGSIFRVTGPLWWESTGYWKSTGYRWISLTNASDADLRYFLCRAPEQTVEQTIETPVIWDTIALIITSPQCYPGEAIWLRRSLPTLVQIIACCLTTPSYYLNQLLIVNRTFGNNINGIFFQNTNIFHEDTLPNLICKMSMCNFKISMSQEKSSVQCVQWYQTITLHDPLWQWRDNTTNGWFNRLALGDLRELFG